MLLQLRQGFGNANCPSTIFKGGGTASQQEETSGQKKKCAEGEKCFQAHDGIALRNATCFHAVWKVKLQQTNSFPPGDAHTHISAKAQTLSSFTYISLLYKPTAPFTVQQCSATETTGVLIQHIYTNWCSKQANYSPRSSYCPSTPGSLLCTFVTWWSGKDAYLPFQKLQLMK